MTQWTLPEVVATAGRDSNPRRPEPLTRRLREPVLAGGAVGLAALALVLRDPHTSGSWGICPFLLLTGHPCPACGGLRATNDLLRGDVAAALGSNAYVVGTIAMVGVLWVLWLVRRTRGLASTWMPAHGRLALWWLAGLLVFGALRFIPALAGLQP